MLVGTMPLPACFGQILRTPRMVVALFVAVPRSVSRFLLRGHENVCAIREIAGICKHVDRCKGFFRRHNPLISPDEKSTRIRGCPHVEWPGHWNFMPRLSAIGRNDSPVIG